MRVSDILRGLPASIDWMVLFDLSAIRPLADDRTVRQMYFLPADADLDRYSHVVLTSHGTALVPHTGLMVDPAGRRAWPDTGRPDSLAERFAPQLTLFEVDRADCLGLGELPPLPPVLLYLRVTQDRAEASAVFHREPSREHYELLRAVGVEFLGGEQQGTSYLARFANRLPVHFQAGSLARFARTAHCTRFFLQHGTIDPSLEAGLIGASEDRVRAGRNRALRAVRRLGLEATREGLALTCRPPTGKPRPYGDLAPLGFVLRALGDATDAPELWERLGACRQVRRHLLERRQGLLWPYHSGGLVTSTDSALALLGFRDRQAVEALEQFADGTGAYHPQLCSEAPETGKMVARPDNRHWCQPDYATTCLVSALRAENELPQRTPTGYFQARFERRSGLYFANPYLVDWALALALAADGEAEPLRQRLRAEILAGMNPDHSFGRYDVALSTAFAILALGALGFRGRTLRLAQLRLLDFEEPDGRWAEATPFYSTLRLDPDRIGPATLVRMMLDDPGRHIVEVDGEYYGIWRYVDEPRLISTAAAAMALAEPCSPAERELPAAEGQVRAHPRYRCRGLSEYVASVALPPYLAAGRHDGRASPAARPQRTG